MRRRWMGQSPRRHNSRRRVGESSAGAVGGCDILEERKGKSELK